jgi:hypothetical protein
MQTTTAATKTCSACKHWKPTDAAGECRRRAPQPVVLNVDDDVKFESHFPITASDDWCGEFEPKTV